jgi:acyl-CoA hydrolase
MPNNRNGKRVAESTVEMTELVLPQDTNPLGNIFGGRVMQLIDIAGGVAAMRHARRIVATVSVDRMDFKHPIKMGQIVTLKAYVVYTGRTSMEVQVDVFSEEPITGDRIHTTSAHLIYVALNQAGQPVAVPPIIPETEAEKERFEEARKRREKLKA